MSSHAGSFEAKRPWWLVIVVVLVLSLTAAGCSAASTGTDGPATPRAGPTPTLPWTPPPSDIGSPAVAVAPDLVLATEGGEFRLSEQLGEVLLLYFSFPG